MAKARTKHVCQQCGHEALAWSGQCPGCGEWNTLVETVVAARAPSGAAPRRGAGAAPRAVPLREVEAPAVARLETGVGELDRVLGGGLVPGSLVLLGGSPGIGKSTITAMALGNLAAGGRSARSTSPARSRRRRCGCAPSGSASTRSRCR